MAKIRLNKLRLKEAGRPAGKYLYYDKKDMSVAWPSARAKVKSDMVEISTAADLEVMSEYDWICDIQKNGRHQRYRQIVGNSSYHGPRLVSEGDSWFLHPQITDTIDHLLRGSSPLAVWSTDCAGDTLATMWNDRKTRGEYWNYTYWSNPRPTIMLLSAGGNDLLGDGKLYFLLNQYTAGKTAEQLINAAAVANVLPPIMSLFSSVLSEMKRDFPNIRVIIHGYDYPRPMNDKWIGQPMQRRGIPQGALQRTVIKVLMDIYNTALQDVLAGFANATYVNLRGTVPANEWFDEIHPNDDGFKKVAKKIRAAI